MTIDIGGVGKGVERVYTRDALGNSKEYEFVNVIDVERGVAPVDDITPAVKQRLEERGYTVVTDATIESAPTYQGKVAYKGEDGQMKVSLGTHVHWHASHLEDEPFILKNVYETRKDYHDITVLETNRGTIDVNEDHMSVDRDLIGEKCCITVTSKRWTGMDYDKNHKLVRYDEVSDE